MARITVNDCLARVPNRFELSLLAAPESLAGHRHAREDESDAA